LTHGSTILSAAHSIFSPLGVSIAGKIAGIHWWYATDSHAAEVTSGYVNTDNQNAYLNVFYFIPPLPSLWLLKQTHVASRLLKCLPNTTPFSTSLLWN
jgi:hypothetical protein